MPRLAGIEFIHKYVHCLYYENMLCRYFSTDDIHHLLLGYEKGYANLLINIYEPVLLSALGCTILGRDTLGTSTSGRAYLQQLFAGMTCNEIFAALQKALDALGSRLQFSKELMRYIKGSLPQLTRSIEAAVNKNSLDRIFPTLAFPQDNPKVIISFGDKMEDDVYRKVVAMISQCRFTQDKMAIIKAHVHTLADLDDVLLDVEWAEDEMISILRDLSLPELAAISKRHQAMADSTQREQILCNALTKYIGELPIAHQASLAKAMDAIEEE